jgi:Flp pilus assembly protein TadD
MSFSGGPGGLELSIIGVSARFESALQHHRAGRPQEAADGYREALRLQPHLPAAHSNLGLVLRDLGHLQAAEPCCPPS